MGLVILYGVLTFLQLCHWYLEDPSEVTVVLPSGVVPRLIGGVFPPPMPPTERYISNITLAAGRKPGDIILKSCVVQEEVSAPRMFPRIGNARVWQVTYKVDVVGPDGRNTIYIDRSAVVLVP